MNCIWISLLLSFMAFAERYVSSLAGGSGNGLSEGTAYTFSQMTTLLGGATSQAGVRFNIKADGTYTRTTGDGMDSGSGGTSTAPAVMRGYKTVIGDGYLGRTGGNGDLITTNMPLINYNPNPGWFKPPNCTIVESLHIQGFVDGDLMTIANSSAVIGCRVNFNGSNTLGTAARFGGDNALAFESDFLITVTGSTGNVVNTTIGGIRLDSCRIISTATGAGGFRGDITAIVYGCLIKGAGGPQGVLGDSANRQPTIRNNTIAGWVDGIKLTASTATNYLSSISGNMITDCTGYAINVPAGWCGIIGPNRVRDCTLGILPATTSEWTNGGRIIAVVTTDTGGPETDYVSAAANNYNLISGSPGKAVNRPIYADMGAYNAQDTGGGGTAVFNPLLTTIIEAAP
jgi:hypothetical protein